MKLNIEIPEQCYIKNPESSEIGNKIISEGLILMNEIGLEEFTFKKLALKIETTESTVYRYFENKNQLLFYYFNYYWSWKEYLLELNTSNILDPKDKLKRFINTIIHVPDSSILSDKKHIDGCRLHELLVVEASKTYMNKHVEKENKIGYFTQYKHFVEKGASIIMEINPIYPYPHALISTMIESNFHQRFYNSHLPRLTDGIHSENKSFDFIFQLCFHSTVNYSTL